MKKLFLVGALAASMAFSSSALAAVEYNDAGSLDITYDGASTISVETDLSSYGDQMTIVIVDGDGNTISDSNIMYIDQAASGAGIFKNMGLLMPTEKDAEGKDVPMASLPVGTYTVKVGGTNLGTDAVPLLTATLTVTEKAEETGTPVTFKWGDVNASGATDNNDAFAILNFKAGGAPKVGSSAYAMDQVLVEGIKWGDVNASGATDNNDAFAILNFKAGGAPKVGSSTYAMDQEVTITIPNAQ